MPEPHFSSDKYLQIIRGTNPFTMRGRISQVVGLTIESQGPRAALGELCYIKNPHFDMSLLPAEVVGFRGNRTLLMPLGEMEGISPGCEVFATGKKLEVHVGYGMVGRVLDGLGQPIDEKGSLSREASYPVLNRAPNPLERRRISQALTVGVRSIDGLLTIGQGQRMGIFAGSGVGKSTLLGMIARNTDADVNVIGLIGERGR
jgi:flagellum-specific ATP synthase